MSSETVVRQRSAEEAFALLGNPIRIGIVRALAATPDETVGFAALRKRVGERDSGNFNYHLGKLTGSFVRRVETDGDDGDAGTATGYELTLAGRQVVGALLAGVYTDDLSLAPMPVGSTCPSCDGPLEARYEAEQVVVQCADCGEFENRHTFPPATVEQFDDSELPAAFDRWLRTSFSRLVAGFCTTCSGRLDAQLVLVDDEEDDAPFEGATAQYTCERCGASAHSSVVMALVHHPGAIAFYYDHGIDVTSAPTWEVVPRADDWGPEVVSEDPLSVRLTIPLDDEELVATIDETVTVTALERRAA